MVYHYVADAYLIRPARRCLTPGEQTGRVVLCVHTKIKCRTRLRYWREIRRVPLSVCNLKAVVEILRSSAEGLISLLCCISGGHSLMLTPSVVAAGRCKWAVRRGRKYSNICSKFCIIGSKPSVFSGQDANMVCPQRTEFSPSDVSGRQSLDLRSCSSCVVSFVHREVVFTPKCTNLCSPEVKKPLRWNVFKRLKQVQSPRLFLWKYPSQTFV